MQKTSVLRHLLCSKDLLAIAGAAQGDQGVSSILQVIAGTREEKAVEYAVLKALEQALTTLQGATKDASGSPAIRMLKRLRELNSASFSAIEECLRAVCENRSIEELADAFFRVFSPRHTPTISALCFSPDSHLIVTAGNDKSVRVWDARNGDILHILPDHGDWHNQVSFSADSCRLFTVTQGSLVREYDVLTGNCLKLIRGQQKPGGQAGVSPGGTYSYQVKDGELAWMELRGGKTVRRYALGESLHSLRFSPDDRYLAASAGEELYIFDAQGGRLLHHLRHEALSVHAIAFDPKGELIAAAVFDGENLYTTARKVLLLGAATGKLLRILMGINESADTLQFSPDGSFVAATHHGSGDDVSSPEIWEVQTGKRIELDGWDCGYDLNFSPDGKRFIVVGEPCYATYESILIWETATGKCLRSLNGHEDSINSAVFSQDGKYVISTSDDNTTKLWDSETGKCLRSIPMQTFRAYEATYSPDGSRAYAVGFGGSDAKLVDARTGDVIALF